MSNKHKILIVEDDRELRGALTDQFSLYEEYEAVGAESGNKSLHVAKTEQIDLVIMDVGLPDIDGREAARMLRRSGFKAPIIMLTGHDTDLILSSASTLEPTIMLLNRSALPCC